MKESQQPFSIRIANPNDAHAIATVHVLSWQKIYRGHIPDSVLDNLSIEVRAKEWHNLLINHLKILVIEVKNQLVGFASICPARDEKLTAKNCGEISAIYLLPSVWRQGLGKKLCEAAMTELKNSGFNEIILWVLKANTQAREFYESIGFNFSGQKKIFTLDECTLGVAPNQNATETATAIFNEVCYQKKLTTEFIFKHLEHTDLDLLCIWLNKPHVKKWWDDNLSAEEIHRKYGDRIGDKDVVPFIIYFENMPIGFIQYYHADKVGNDWWPDEQSGTIGIDQFIGEENYMNRGYGTQMIKAFIQKLLAMPDTKKIITDVDPENFHAVRCYEKVGFKFAKSISTPDGNAHLMIYHRPPLTTEPSITYKY